MQRVYDAVMVAGAVTVLACNNPDVPEVEPTIGFDTEPPGGSGDGSGGEGSDGSGGPTPNLCWPNELVDPALYQCVGEGIGSFVNKACRKVTGCSTESDWDNSQTCLADEVNGECEPVPFPPEPPEEEPNAQACCEQTAALENIDPGCREDCARGACRTVLDKLEAERAGSPPPGCPIVAGCVDRWKATLDTWIAFLRANFDVCVEVALTPGARFDFPNPDVESGAGAGKDAELRIDCAITDEPMLIANECEESLNPPVEVDEDKWLCDLEGAVEVNGPEGSAVSPLEGAVSFRAGDCRSTPCWVSIEQMVLEADDYSKSGYGVSGARAMLAYPAFGLVDAAGNATIAPTMLGVEASFFGWTPTTTTQGYTITMANSDSAILDMRAGIEISDATFGWEDHVVTIRADSRNCTAVSAASALDEPGPAAPQAPSSSEATGSSGCGCRQHDSGGAGIAMLGFVALLGLRARRQKRRIQGS